MRILQFDEIVIDVEKMEVLKGSEAVDLEPKSFRVLVYLAENANRVVTKEELLKEIWNGSFVTDNALTRVIAQLRKALGDDAKQARYIETVPTVGYRLLADVRLKTEGAVEVAPADPEPPVPEYVPRKINWWIPIGALSAIVLAYVMPFIRIWTSGGAVVLKPVQFTTTDGLDLHGSFSPDGSNLTYSSDRSGFFEIYVKQVTPGSQEIPITRDRKQNLQPSWSPDGSRIAFVSLGNHGIFVVPALGGMPSRLTDFGSQPVWSPDSKQIVFRSEGVASVAYPEMFPASDSTLWIVPAEGGKPELLMPAKALSGRQSHPHFSPDGRRLGFLFIDFGGWKTRQAGIGELDLQTKQVTKIDMGGQHPVDFVYSPDGNTLFFLGLMDNDTSGFYRLPRGGAPEQLMRFDFAQIRDIAITARGNRIAYSATRMFSNLWRVSAGETKQVTTESAFRVTQPVFSPDGTKLAYLQRQLGLMGDVWMSDPDGGNAVQLTKHPQSSAFMPSWLPDGKGLVYTTNRDRSLSLYRFSLTDGSERPFLKLDAQSWWSRLSPDGKEVAYHREQGPKSNVWKLDVATGKETQLTFGTDETGFPCWSPDGKQIAVQITHGDDTHMGVVPSGGGPIRQLTNRPGHAWAFSWSPDGKELAMSAAWDGAWNIYSLNVETGGANKLTDNKLFRIFLRYPARSPKGDPIVFEQNETKGNIYLADMPR